MSERLKRSNARYDGWPPPATRRFFSFKSIVLGVAGVVLLAPQPSSAAVRVDLDGDWRFRVDPASRLAGYDPALRVPDPDWRSGMRVVRVPHTWNIGPDHGFDGVGWYARTITLPAALASQHVELNFGATFSVSRVWVNGVPVGGHVGGYTAYALDISKAVHAGDNQILVAVDDRPGFATVPGYAMRLAASGSVDYDWQANGGLVRDVWLTVGDGGLIRRQSLNSAIRPGLATVLDRVTIQNITGSARNYRVKITAVGPDGVVAARGETALTAEAGGEAQGAVTLAIVHPKLWNVGAAQLYQVTAELEDGSGRALDRREDPLGLRTVEIRDRRLFVNGQPVRLTGVSRHEDSPAEGLAETRGTIEADWNDLAALHVTLTRPVHYPQPTAVLDAADRDGVLLIPEIPVWQMTEAQLRDPRLVAAAQAMMTEMIAQDADHPSIMAWSVCNESEAATPGGRAYVQAMKALINRLDPGRYVTFADSSIAARPWVRQAVMDDVDFIMANAYFGTWSGAAADVEPWLDYMDKAYPDKMVIISEFGWPGPFSKDPAAADLDRVANLQGQLAAFARRPFVGGAIFWTYQDYRSRRNLWPGETDGFVDHGLVDAFRQRRPSYAVWQRANEPLKLAVDWRFGAAGPDGFSAVVTPNAPGTLPSFPLIGYRARWRVVGDAGRVLGVGEALLDLGGPASLSSAWTAAGDAPVTLHFDVVNAQGVRAAVADLDYRPLRFGFTLSPPDPQQLPAPEPKS